MRQVPLLFCTVFAIAQSVAASAAEIGECNNLDRVSFLVGQTKSFAQGKIRIAHVDTEGEPVCCSAHLLVFIPDKEIGTQCFALSQKAATGDRTSATGFFGVTFEKIVAAYDAARGLLLTVPYTLYDPHTDKTRPGQAKVRVDLRGEGSVKVEP